MKWTYENINEYMKDLAKEAKGLQRMGWAVYDVREFIARAGLFEF